MYHTKNEKYSLGWSQVIMVRVIPSALTIAK